MKFNELFAYWDAALSNIDSNNLAYLSIENLAKLNTSLEKLIISSKETTTALTLAENGINAVMEKRNYADKPWNALGYCMKTIETIRDTENKTMLLQDLLPSICQQDSEAKYSTEESLAFYHVLSFIAAYHQKIQSINNSKLNTSGYRKKRTVLSFQKAN